MDMKLAGKTALINGGSEGMGFAAAMALAEEGATITLTARDEPRLELAADKIRAATGVSVYTKRTDICIGQECVDAVTFAVECMGGIDVLLCNDGNPPLGPALDFDDHEWQRALERNFFSVLRLIRGSAASMRQRGGGSIICITSTTVFQPRVDFGLPTTTWAAVHTLCKTLSRELAADKIRVNVICPGVIETPHLQRVREELEEFSPEEYVRDAVPLARVGEAEEVGALVTFLASPRSAYMTGLALQIDGGARLSM
jgi:3-oxoacyl-[acyl-carrier protein] reductase